MTCLKFRHFFLVTLYVFSQVSHAAVYQGLVVGVKDGDTVVVLTDEKQQVTVRLDSIDAPEKKMPYGSVAKKALSDLTYKKRVTVDSHKTDRYGRTVAEIWLEKRLVNLDMVKNGMAWNYVKYSRDPAYAEAEVEARANKRGLWSQPDPQAPWEFRHPNVTASPGTRTMPLMLASANIENGCGTKRYCKQMSSREEANYYLNQCGLTRLDRDGDGQACENLH